MFHLSSFGKKVAVGVIKCDKRPMKLRWFKDIEGKTWDIKSLFYDERNEEKIQMVHACPVSELHPYYTDTSGSCSYGFVHQEWKPYWIELVGG